MIETRVNFEAVSFHDLPGWEEDDHAAALKAFLNSCERLTDAAERGSLTDPGRWAPLLAVCREAQTIGDGAADARQFFETRFTPHRVIYDRDNGLLTGYYEPVLAGSRVRQGPFQIPVYRRPPDLVNLMDESMRGTAGEAFTHARRTKDGQIVPYAARAEIETGALSDRGLELLYLADPVDAFFMHIQGSGLVELTDGTSVRVSYDGKNGHPYTSIGRYLVEAGLFRADEVSLDTLKQWLRADPERGREVMWQNRSYIFFRELTGPQAQSALGTMDIPLTAGRSLAVDAGVHAIGTPVYVVAPDLTHTAEGGPFRRLMIAQDVGSAIKGPERGDIYFGSGSEAGDRAGRTRHAGNFFVLLPRGNVGPA